MGKNKEHKTEAGFAGGSVGTITVNIMVLDSLSSCGIGYLT